MKKLTLITTATIMLSACSTNVTDVKGDYYKPDALLVHDQTTVLLIIIALIICIAVIVICARLKAIKNSVNILVAKDTNLDAIQFSEDEKERMSKALNAKQRELIEKFCRE